MIYELLTISVLTRLKVIIRTDTDTYSLRVRFNTRHLWIGLDVCCEHPDWIGLDWIH